jgi:hypothetical protein
LKKTSQVRWPNLSKYVTIVLRHGDIALMYKLGPSVQRGAACFSEADWAHTQI